MMMIRKCLLGILLLSSWGKWFAQAEDIGEGSGFTHDDSYKIATQEILLDLYGSAKGLRWKDSTGWLKDEDQICSWHGITCYGNQTTTDLRRVGYVQKLDLSNNHLVGSIPSSLWSLPYVQTINLRDNADLSIDFSEIGEAQYLKILNVANTLVSSLEGIGQLSNNLQSLQIASLGFEGPLPDEVFDLTNLKGLYANYNHFNGTLPTRLGTLTELTDLYLYYNDFAGTIPTEIGLLTGLKVLTMAQNAFSGALPEQLNRLTDLEIFAIHRIQDQEKGFGITGKLPSFSNLRSISQLYMENQGLKGSIPSDFLASANPENAIKVNLMNNHLTGAIPPQLTKLSQLQPLFGGNKITEVSVQLCQNIGDWLGGLVGDLRKCDAFLCPKLTFAPEGRATRKTPCSPCATNGKYYGATTCASAITSKNESLSERQILIELYNRMGGRNWPNSNNWLDLSVGICDWYGIQCFNNSVTGIILKNNGLIDSPPTELFELANLIILNFNGNSIDFDFTGISQLANLEILDLSQTDLSSLEGIQELSETNIRELLLPSNRLHGTIPPALFTLETLEKLDLSYNRFEGNLPSQVMQLPSLRDLRCFGNNLSGQIPSELGSLTALTALLCDENEFGGTLPTELNQLTNLQALSFRQSSTVAAIGGPLLSFSNLRELTSLHMDSNKLVGPLPSGFLQNTDRGSDRIEVMLGDNMLTGFIPGSWGSRFDRLFIDLTGNNITEIDPSLCNKDNWMDGQVANYNCDAILCPINTYNDVGRQASSSTFCDSCPPESTSSYLGSKDCGLSNLTSGNEFNVLETFYYSVGGNLWSNTSGWLTEADFCQGWYGITCDGDGHVTKVSLNGNGLQGTVSPVVFDLPYLNELDLGNNQISISFSGIGKAERLELLNLEGNGLDSLTGIGQGTSLVTLMLTDNDLTSLPSELFRLSNLQSLYLNYNQISGRIPSDISKLSNLEQLFLFRNQFTGQIPASFGSLTLLKTLALAGNNIGGTLPPELNEMSSLEVLSIEREIDTNSTTGWKRGDSSDSFGIVGPLLSFNNMKNIKWIYLAGNSLSGTIPFGFLDGKLNKTEEIDVDLTSNQITGQLPPSLAQFEQLNLYVSDNRITSIPAGLCAKTLWLNGEVGFVGSCDAILCPNNTYSPIGRAEQTTNNECTPCPSGTHSNFYGSLRCYNSSDMERLNEREVLEEFYTATGGSEWTNNGNWLDPNEPICNWYGVYCDDPDEESVAGIVLERNGLIGTVPDSIYELSNLQEINFAGNEVVLNFRGITPDSRLGFLNLDDTATSSLDGIEQSNVIFLHIGGNDFGGSFPTEILALTILEALYMSSNNFGSLPSEIGLLSDLSVFECGRCGLTGKLPTWIGNLGRLEYLTLYQNFFTGEIPSAILNLRTLKHLDLSVQGFNGSLPDFAEMTNLTEVILSGNDFIGTIAPSFLNSVPSSSDNVLVKLENNQISGSIPDELIRFTNMTLYLANNKIESIPPALCNTSWNDGDVKEFGCSGILCEKGFYNAYGRATGTYQCSRCNSSKFLGSTSCGGDIQNESDILIKFFQETNGFGWTDSNGWFEDLNYCVWAGITCRNGTIRSIKIDNNNLAGNISSSIWQLSNLEELDLSENNVSVTFDGIENAPKLRTLLLSQTFVSSLVGIGRAGGLVELYLNGDKISGVIPTEIFKLTALETLDLGNNELSGTLPTLIGNLRSLQKLYLFQNKLSGTIPTEVGNLNSARVIALGENLFNGTIPVQLNYLLDLEILSLQGRERQLPTSLLGLQPSFPQKLPDFSLMSNLHELYLGHLQLTGPIPTNFLNAANTSELLVVDLTSNLITGAIPTELGRFTQMNLYLADNNINFVPPSICAKSDWLDGDLAFGCDALLCPPGTYNQFGRQVGSDQKCEACTFGTAIEYGTIDCGFPGGSQANESQKLSFLFDATNGTNWKRQDNWKTSTKVCEWYGVRCSSTGDVVELNLQSNNLVGTIPSGIYFLQSLKVLNIAQNDVDISFDHIETAKSLQELHLNSTFISSLDGIGGAKSLVKVFAPRSKLAGVTIPDEVYELTGLQAIDLSNNNLIGTLSPAIGNLSTLLFFDCQGNSLTGGIPSEVGLLALLQVLDLSENSIEGSLPMSLNGMSSLKHLRLNSYTQNIAGITGPILSFSNISSLEEISFASNSLTGTLPVDLLAGAGSSMKAIKINLQSNQIQGTIPSEYSRFRKLDLELGGNLITEIGDGLCDLSGWMNGDVASFGCEGILCPEGTFNAIGRQSENLPCQPCERVGDFPFLGSVTCFSLEKLKEKDILESFFRVTGGESWYAKDGWLDDSKDICEWHGVSCVDGIVSSIVLGGNNLVGTPPAELFQLATLQQLWLYSNPIQFSFQGIEQATTLRSLSLAATGLVSIEGIGDAPALADIDVSFNQLKGSLPADLSKLRSLENFSCSNNLLTGTLPSFSTNTKLATLRLGNNTFSGSLPSFDLHLNLTSIDVSGNLLAGAIPNDLLQGVEVSKRVFLDLSSNSLSGSIPSELSRFSELTILLKENKIDGIGASLCSQKNWNNGDVGTFKCNGILCPPKTYSVAFGRASPRSRCQSCDGAAYFGATTCNLSSGELHPRKSLAPLLLVLNVVLLRLMVW